MGSERVVDREGAFVAEPRRPADALWAPGSAVTRQGDVLLSPSTVLQLQREVGNRAVARLAGAVVQRRGPEPQEVQPPDGLGAMGGAGGRGQPLGDTQSRSTPPSFDVVRSGGTGRSGWTGRLQPVPRPASVITPLYPAPGAYQLAGAARWVIVDRATSDEVKAGEQEHSDDMDGAAARAYRTPAAAINTVARQPAKSGPNVADVHRQWREALRRQLPPQLRAPVAERSPSTPWSRAYAALHQASLNRDAQGRHSLRQRDATTPERARHDIPAGDEAKAVTGSIRRRPSAEVIDDAWSRLPTQT